LGPLFSQPGVAMMQREALLFETQPLRCRGAGRGFRDWAARGANAAAELSGRNMREARAKRGSTHGIAPNCATITPSA